VAGRFFKTSYVLFDTGASNYIFFPLKQKHTIAALRKQEYMCCCMYHLICFISFCWTDGKYVLGIH
jgi:hypothetical protein